MPKKTDIADTTNAKKVLYQIAVIEYRVNRLVGLLIVRSGKSVCVFLDRDGITSLLF